MEENNLNQQQNNNEPKKHICFENHCWKKCLAMVIASFLGSFLAFYFVADQAMYRQQKHIPPHHFEKRMFDDFERMHHKKQHDIDKMFESIEKEYKNDFLY